MINGTTSYLVGNTSTQGFQSIDFIIKNEVGGDADELATLSITITTPNTGARIYFSQLITMK